MRFENPVALTLLLLIPLLLFMRRRRTHVQRPVANLYLWRESAASDTNTLARRIRRDWLLILQAAFLAVVACAAARPVIADTRGSVAFVIDTSLSMGARQGADTRLDLAKARAAELLNRLPSGARVRVVATGGSDPLAGSVPGADRDQRPLATSDPALLNAIRSARTTDGNGDLAGAIERARQARPAPDRVYVFSDIDAARVTARGADLEWITVGSRTDNAAITVFGARPSPVRQDAKQILVTVANYGAATIDADLRLATDAAEIARQRVMVGPRSSSSYSFDLANAAGVLVARLDHQDALAADNVRWLALPAGDRIRLFLPSTPGFFLGKALAAHPEFVQAASADDADVIVCDRCSELPGGTAGVLLVNSPSGTAVSVTLGKVETDHPIADGLELDGARAVLRGGIGGGIGGGVGGSIAPPPASTVIIRGNGEAALVAYETGTYQTGRRVVDSRIDFEDGPFPLNAAFPVLVANAIRWVANRDANPRTLNAGEPLRWLVNEQRAPVVVGPDGRTIPSTFNGGVLSTSETGAAGLYRIQLGSTQQAVVVNPVVDGESNLEPAPPPTIPNVTAAVPDDVRHREIATILMLAALLLLALEWRHGRGHLVVRCAVAGLLVLAVAGLRLPVGKLPLTVVFLVDASHSMSASRAEVQSRLSSLSSRLGRDDQAGVILFGARPVIERGLGQPGNAGGQMAATVAGGATDVEAALRLARNTLPLKKSLEGPGEASRRIVLLSDGNETRGSAMREASRAAADGIAIDASVPSPRASSPPLRVSRLSAPAHAAVDEPFAITALVEGPPDQRAELVIQGDDGTSVRREVRFGAGGSATETLTAREREPGLRVYRASIQTLEGDIAPGPSEPTAGALVSVSGTPRVLVVGARAGRLDGILAPSYDVRHLAPQDLPRSTAGFSTYDAVILDDVSEDALDARQMAALSSHVETRGAGLLVLGSPRTLDAAVVPDAGLGKLLPVDVRPRAGVRAPELALVVVFDKSGSMEERVGGVAKIELARQSITRVLEAVPATDSVGVIAFDSRPSIVATLRPGHDPRAIAEQLRTLSPAGATAIAPAVELAGQWLSAFPPTVRRHILLVSDGRSSTADSERLQSLGREGRFTLSVVSLGADRDQQFLSALAVSAGGRAYFPEDERQLPNIAAREAARVAGGRVVEDAFVPRTSSHPILGGIDPRSMPALSGYVVTAARRSAEVVLASHRDDPIIATWQYGVGRVAVYTADLSSTWSAGLRRSPVLGPLMNQAVRWLARRQPDDFLYARLQADGDVVRVVLDAQVTDDNYATGLTSQATIQPPTGQPLTIDLAEQAPGRYEGTFPATDVGEYVVSLAARSADGRVDARMIRGFFWSGDKEYRAAGVNRDLLSQLARTTGGTLLEGDADAFSNRPRAYRNANTWLVGSAFLLFLGHLIAPGMAAILRRVLQRQAVPPERAAA